MKFVMDVDERKLRLALIGNGYTLKEVEAMDNDRLIEVFNSKVTRMIESEYKAGLRLGLYEEN